MEIILTASVVEGQDSRLATGGRRFKCLSAQVIFLIYVYDFTIYSFEII